MRAFLAILVVAVTLAVASQTVSAAQYFLTVQYSAAGCSATPGNSWSQATVRPTNSCQIATASGYGSKFECNATHVLEYECTIVDGACQCLLNRETPIGCMAGEGTVYYEVTCPTAASQNAVIQTLRTNVTMTKIETNYIFSSECSTSDANVSKVVENPSCQPLFSDTKRGVQEGYYYGNMYCNSTAIYFYGCNDSLCNDCATTLSKFSDFSVCGRVRGADYLNNTCLIMEALPAPVAPPVAAPVAAPVAIAAPTAAPTATGNAPTAPKAPSVTAPSGSASSIVVSVAVASVALFVALAV